MEPPQGEFQTAHPTLNRLRQKKHAVKKVIEKLLKKDDNEAAAAAYTL